MLVGAFNQEKALVGTFSKPSFEALLSSFVPLLDYEVATNICLVLNVIISLFFPLNFAIYCGMSQHFRDTFASLFFRKNVKNKVLDSASR